LPNNILRISEKYLNNPERIAVGSLSTPIEKIKQETFQLTQDKKYHELINQLVERNGSILVFVKTKHGADKIVKRLKYDGHSADAIHGNLRQSKRDRVITGFRNGKSRILIATDVAARGLDIPLIQHVINYDLPQVPEDYIHRIGRTGRAGKEGSALTFLTPGDKSMWNSISKLIDPDFKSSLNKHKSKFKKKKRPNGSFDKKRKYKDKKKFIFKKSNFKENKKFFNNDKSKKSRFKDKKKKFGFTNNPKYFEKTLSNETNANKSKKGFKFKNNKKFKNRKRPKKFSFKRYKKNNI